MQKQILIPFFVLAVSIFVKVLANMDFKMNDIAKLIPAKKNHSISEAIFSLFLVNPIIASKRFRELLMDGQPLSKNFQRFKENKSVALSFSIKSSKEGNLHSELHNLEPKETEDGFVMEAFSEGKLAWFIRYDPLMPVLSIHSFMYSNWNEFYESVFTYLKAISDFDNSIYVSGYALNYVDDFDWIDSLLPNMETIFNKGGRYLPPLIFEAREGWSFSANQVRNLENTLVLEHTNVSINSTTGSSHKITLSHHAASDFTEYKSLTTLCLEKTELKTFANKIHNLNKEFLKETLTQAICSKIGLK
ncbi:MAG: hypothetical protein QM541_11910 [Flavobacterium sp.]|nr:hypothetical protein [Flavobacterium sp.]